MKVEGKVINVTPVQQVSDKFKKCEVWVETNDQYPQVIPVQFSQDKAESVQSVNVGVQIEIDINLRGRLWTSKSGEERCFATIEGWRYTAYQGDAAPEIEQEYNDVDTGDDLPF